MNVEKIINALASSIKNDLDTPMFGGFGDNNDRIDGRLEDLIVIAKTIHDNVLLKQVEKAEKNLINDDTRGVIKVLDNLVVEAK